MHFLKHQFLFFSKQERKAVQVGKILQITNVWDTYRSWANILTVEPLKIETSKTCGTYKPQEPQGSQVGLYLQT